VLCVHWWTPSQFPIVCAREYTNDIGQSINAKKIKAVLDMPGIKVGRTLRVYTLYRFKPSEVHVAIRRGNKRIYPEGDTGHRARVVMGLEIKTTLRHSVRGGRHKWDSWNPDRDS
jgi:hypothetical protein